MAEEEYEDKDVREEKKPISTATKVVLAVLAVGAIVAVIAIVGSAGIN